MRVTKQQLIDFLNDYDEEDYEVRVQDESGEEHEIVELDWANGPWIILEAIV